MVLQQNTRVRRLHLTGDDETTVRRATILLEDAFHIASLPTGNPRRMVIVRSLHLGVLNTDHSSAGFALKIAHNLGKLQSTAIHAEATNAVEHHIVFFHDEIEPYRCLAARIARNEDTSAWFWPLAVPCWRPDLSPCTALRTILFHIIQTEARAVAALTLLSFLQEHNGLDNILEALNSQDGHYLLQACGWSVPVTFPERTTPPLEHNTTSPQNNIHKMVSLQWRPTLKRWIGRWGKTDSRTMWLAAMLILEKNPTYLMNSSLLNQAKELIECVATQSHRNSPRPHITKQETFFPGKSSTEAIDQFEQTVETPLTRADMSHLTEYAGLFFLIPILTHLGMPEWLKTNPQYVEINFPNLVFEYVARSLGIPDSDPVLSAFKFGDDEDRDAVCEFIAPDSWQEGLCTTNFMVIREMADPRHTRFLYDDSGRFPLALWQGPIPPTVEEVIGNRSLQKGLPILPTTHLNAVLRAWHMAVRRWCRRYAHLGLYNLICRPGHIVSTPTHIDLIFDLCQIDIRVRMSGLDINPGWVSWLGRVVQFHYVEGENEHDE